MFSCSRLFYPPFVFVNFSSFVPTLPLKAEQEKNIRLKRVLHDRLNKRSVLLQRLTCCLYIKALHASSYLLTFILGQGKSVPLQARGSQRVPGSFPDYVIIAQNGGKVVSLTHRPFFTPRKYSWYSFLLEAESTPHDNSAIGRIMSMKNSSDSIWNRTSDISICSTAP